jgi:hypothetical protein
MIRSVSRQLQREIGFYRGANGRRPGRVSIPTTIFTLMLDNPVRRLAEALGVARPKQRMQQNVIGLERGIGFQFAAPISTFVLGREKKAAGGSMAAPTRLAKPSIFPKRSWGAEAILDSGESVSISIKVRLR